MTPFHQRIKKVRDLTPECNYRVDVGLLGVPRFIEQYSINIDPDYQRGYVWTVDQKRAFVGAVIQNHNSIPIFWFNRLVYHRNASDVVDGKQRLSAILGWINNEYSAICPCGEEFWCRDQDEIGHRNLAMMTTLKMHFVQLKRKEVLRFYLALNSGGTVHTDKDLDKVRKLLEGEK